MSEEATFNIGNWKDKRELKDWKRCIKIYDNSGETTKRYKIIIAGSVYTLDDDLSFGHDYEERELEKYKSEIGEEINYYCLPKRIQTQFLYEIVDKIIDPQLRTQLQKYKNVNEIIDIINFGCKPYIDRTDEGNRILLKADKMLYGGNSKQAVFDYLKREATQLEILNMGVEWK